MNELNLSPDQVNCTDSLIYAMESAGIPLVLYFMSHYGVESMVDIPKLSSPHLRDVWYFNHFIVKSYSRVFIKGTTDQLVLFRLYL